MTPLPLKLLCIAYLVMIAALIVALAIGPLALLWAMQAWGWTAPLWVTLIAMFWSTAVMGLAFAIVIELVRG